MFLIPGDIDVGHDCERPLIQVGPPRQRAFEGLPRDLPRCNFRVCPIAGYFILSQMDIQRLIAIGGNIRCAHYRSFERIRLLCTNEQRH